MRSHFTCSSSPSQYSHKVKLLNNHAGRVVNRDYQVAAKVNRVVIDRLRGDDLSEFPIEHARLRTSKFAIAICAPLIAVYGWVLQLKTV